MDPTNPFAQKRQQEEISKLLQQLFPSSTPVPPSQNYLPTNVAATAPTSVLGTMNFQQQHSNAATSLGSMNFQQQHSNAAGLSLGSFQQQAMAQTGIPNSHVRDLLATQQNFLAQSVLGDSRRWDSLYLNRPSNQPQLPPQPNPRIHLPTTQSEVLRNMTAQMTQMYASEPSSAIQFSDRLNVTGVPKPSSPIQFSDRLNAAGAPKPSSPTQMSVRSNATAGSNEANDLVRWLKQNVKFIKNLYNALEHVQFPSALGWSTDGTGFYLNPDHPEIFLMLRKYFNLTKDTWQKEFNAYPWRKDKGMIHHPHFHRGMGWEDFRMMAANKEHFNPENTMRETIETIEETLQKRATDDIRNDDIRKFVAEKKKAAAAKKAATEAAKMKDKQTHKVATWKKNGPIASKTKRDKPTKIASVTKKSKGTTAASKGIEKKKTPPVAEKSSLNRKKRKKPLPDSPKKRRPDSPKKPLPDSSDTIDARKTKKKPSVAEKRLKKRLQDHRKLHNLFWKWDMWNYPEGLDYFLESGKVQHYVPKQTKKTRKADAADMEPEFDGENSQEKISDLLCDEELPDSIFGNDKKDDKQALADFVDRIRQDKLLQEKLETLTSNTVMPYVKGKLLPVTKFAKPTDKWKTLKVGDRIGVSWLDDGLFYNASITKQQVNTSYFYLIYDDDGAREWLDLSKNTFKILDDPLAVIQSPPRRVTSAIDDTPRKDNRAQRVRDSNRLEVSKSIRLPDRYSHLAPFVRYSWKGLKLGSESGTPAYNKFVGEKDPSAPAATALDILNDVRALRSGAFPGIPLEMDCENALMIDSTTTDNGDDNENGRDKLPNLLRYLRDKISKENSEAGSSFKQFDETLKAVRKKTDKWSVPTLRKNLRTMETQILKLKEREAKILVKCQKKGLCP